MMIATRVYACLLVVAGYVWGQVVPTVPAVGGPPTASASTTNVSASVPSEWFGAGGGYDQSSGQGTAWLSAAKLIDAKSQLYSYSSYHVVRANGGIATSGNTGFGMGLRQFGTHIVLIGFVTPGLQQNSTAVKLNVTGGGALIYRATSGWTAEIVVRAVNGSTGPYIFEFGTGWAK